jgi:anti-sigma factor RsiW
MSDNPLQHELDDELLSAYLDDELAAEERALVEARLAADPAARQLLDELRHVSQAIRGLPQETLRRDMRESILRRATEEKSSAQRPKSDDAPGPLPKFAIGRTRRAWVWAALAAAAALLIMFVERNPLEEEDRPSVALRRHAPPSLTVAPEFAPPAPSQAAGRDMAETNTTRAPAAAGGAASAARIDATDELAGAPASEPVGEFDQHQPVVVHVVAKREAIENKMFDQLLLSNGIAIQSAMPADSTVASADRYRTLASSSRTTERAAAPPADEDAEVDVVLVEAPPTKILSCLADLNQDSANYLSVSVDESPSAGKAPAPAAAPAKKIEMDLGKYSRGVVSQQQKDFFSRNKAFYYQQAPDGNYFGAGRGGALDMAESIEQEASQRRQLARDHSANEGRAQRVQVSKTEDRQAGELRKLGRQLIESSESASENLQVFFVLAPGEEPAASPPAENRAE